jgi:predicted kinase
MSFFLLQMAGLTGSGKTSLSRAIGGSTGAAVIDKDVIMGAAERFGIAPPQLGGLAYEVGWDLTRSMLANRMSVVLDYPASFVQIRDKGARIAREASADYYIIECFAPEAVADERIRDRTPAHSLHPTTRAGQDNTYSRPGTAPLTEPHLTLDTTRPLDVCLREALEYIGR